MYLLDTNVISEQRKKNKANPSVKQLFEQLATEDKRAYEGLNSLLFHDKSLSTQLAR